MGTAGFSLRQSLINQGVTTEEALRAHLNLAYGTIQALAQFGMPTISVNRYKVSKNNPNQIDHS